MWYSLCTNYPDTGTGCFDDFHISSCSFSSRRDESICSKAWITQQMPVTHSLRLAFLSFLPLLSVCKQICTYISTSINIILTFKSLFCSVCNYQRHNYFKSRSFIHNIGNTFPSFVENLLFFFFFYCYGSLAWSFPYDLSLGLCN